MATGKQRSRVSLDILIDRGRLLMKIPKVPTEGLN